MGLNMSLSDLPEPYRKQATEKILSQMKKKQTAPPQPIQKEKKTPKLHNKKVERGGKTFDSIKEANRACADGAAGDDPKSGMAEEIPSAAGTI